MPEHTRAQQDHAAIRALYARWFGAMEGGDIDGFLALLADDFVLKSPTQPAVTEHALLRQHLEQFHASLTEKVDYTLEEVHICGDWAWVRITERVMLTPRDGSEPLRISGMHLGILARQADGTWRVSRDVSSLDHG